MKRSVKTIVGAALAVHGMILFVWVAAALAGREIVWRAPLGTAVGVGVLTVAACVCLFLSAQAKAAPWLSALLLGVSTASAVPLLTATNWGIFCFSAAVCVVTLVRVSRPTAAKVMFGIFFGLLLLLVTAAFSIGMLFLGVRAEEIAKEVPSPDGRCTARLTMISSGALGGDTVVEVYQTARDIDLWLCTVQEPPVVLYTGETYGDSDCVSIVWEDSDSVTVTVDAEHPFERTFDFSF